MMMMSMMMMSTMISIIMYSSYAKHLEPVGCFNDKYVEEFLMSKPDTFMHFITFDTFDTIDTYHDESMYTSYDLYDSDTKLCSYECELVGAPYLIYTKGNKCICIAMIGDLGNIPCEEDESIIFGFVDDNDDLGYKELPRSFKSGNNLRADK